VDGKKGGENHPPTVLVNPASAPCDGRPVARRRSMIFVFVTIKANEVPTLGLSRFRSANKGNKNNILHIFNYIDDTTGKTLTNASAWAGGKKRFHLAGMKTGCAIIAQIDGKDKAKCRYR
jgi:hypothetical protein